MNIFWRTKFMLSTEKNEKVTIMQKFEILIREEYNLHKIHEYIMLNNKFEK